MYENVKITPGLLSGKIDIPPSKSLSHRAIICGGLSPDTSKIENLIISEDIEATIGAMKSFGSIVYNMVEDNDRYSLELGILDNIKCVKEDIYCNESGSTIRFMIPFAGLTGSRTTFHGKGRLVERPLDTYYRLFEKKSIDYGNDDGRLPLWVDGKLHSGTYEIPGNISSQFITGLLFVLPLLDGDSKLIISTPLESKGYVDLTLDVIGRFGIQIEHDDYKEFKVKGNQSYKSCTYRVEGDLSQAAFWIVAGVLSDGIDIYDINRESKQGDRAIIDIVKEMGGDLSWTKDCLKIKATETIGVEIDASQCPDLVPILATLGSVSKGITRIYNAERVRIKESDRLKAIATELNKLGADISETDDGLIINGVQRLSGGIVDSWNDHRIAMALAVAAIKADGEVIIKDSKCVNKSYPHFWEDYKALGGIVHEWRMGK